MIEFILATPIALKVIILSGLTLIIIELFKEERRDWKERESKRY